jgi:hypothetical protein
MQRQWEIVATGQGPAWRGHISGLFPADYRALRDVSKAVRTGAAIDRNMSRTPKRGE